MLLNSVVIVLREVLEAALLLSVLLASGRFLDLDNRWIRLAMSLGIVGAAVYGYMLGPISDLFDGVGQEVVNALLQFVDFVFVVAVVFLASCRMQRPHRYHSALQLTMAAAVALAVVREGAEILIYVSGFWSMGDVFSAVGIGSIIGASIGFSVGVLIYFLLLAQPRKRALPVIVLLLLFIAAGMSSQATRLLIQADWISTAGALWDTSTILSEDSPPGQLLYALVGYEASPAAIEVVMYIGGMLLVVAAHLAGRLARPSEDDGPQ
jgi:high-affinity iron transporter